GVRPSVRVEEIAVLARSGVAEIAHCEPKVVDPEELGEHEGGTGFRRVCWNHWVGNGGPGDGAARRGRRVGGETVDLAIVAEIEAHHPAVVVDPLSVNDVRRNTRGAPVFNWVSVGGVPEKLVKVGAPF